MVQTCTKCGAVNEAGAMRCCFCDARLAETDEVPAAAAPSAPTEGNLAIEVDWRREVAHRLEAYRARRRRLHPDESQVPLPFFSTTDAEPADPSEWKVPVDKKTLQASIVERMEIAVTQPDFGAAGDRSSSLRAPAGATLLPVAALAERRRAGLLDAAFLLLAYGGFLTMFGSLGGQFALAKPDAIVHVATLILFYAQYFGLFTVFGGSTPGMQLAGLRLVSFEGGTPELRQLLWRSFGYLISGGTFLLGFLWALWDEDHLTWQDHISQTYITYAQKPKQSEPSPVPE